MDLGLLVEAIRKTATEVKTEYTDIEFFFFGSILKGHCTKNDIDILVIYSDTNEPKIVRNSFHYLSMTFPLHFTFLKKNEENEFDFIKLTNAKSIWK